MRVIGDVGHDVVARRELHSLVGEAMLVRATGVARVGFGHAPENVAIETLDLAVFQCVAQTGKLLVSLQR